MNTDYYYQLFSKDNKLFQQKIPFIDCIKIVQTRSDVVASLAFAMEEARPKKWIRQFREYMGELGVGLLQVGGGK